jgi:ribosome biogenesis GTPase
VTDPSSVLVRIGFDSYFQSAFAAHADAGHEAARVAVEHRDGYVLLTAAGEITADLSGRLRHTAQSRADLPAVGDWVAIRAAPDRSHAVIHAVMPRRSAFVRGAAGGATEPQVVAANIDVVLLVCALGADFNVRRLERYLAVTRASNADPVIVLTKADLHAITLADARAEAERVAALAPVHVISSVTGDGLDAIAAYVAGDRTIALLGSSGAGKSTLVNRLAGLAEHRVGPLGVDGRGQHTTTHRELVVLPGGGILIDTPGMRELRLWDDRDDALDETFDDVAAIAARCRFRDCAHANEVGCAIHAAIDDGSLAADRWESYTKLAREVASLAARKDARGRQEERRRIKVMARAIRARERARR